MQRKVTEWGCMQALIDFDGWRKWKGLAAQEEAKKESKKGESKADQKAALKALFSQPPKSRKEREKESAQAGGPAGGPAATLGGGIVPPAVRTKSPNNPRKTISKTSTMDVNGSGHDGKSDLNTSGSTVMLEKR
jgi:hypothetical protein